MVISSCSPSIGSTIARFFLRPVQEAIAPVAADEYAKHDVNVFMTDVVVDIETEVVPDTRKNLGFLSSVQPIFSKKFISGCLNINGGQKPAF